MEVVAPQFQLNAYLISPRVVSFASEAFDVLSGSGQPLFYVRVRRYIPRAEMRFFHASDHSQELLNLKARRVFSNSLDVSDPSVPEPIGWLSDKRAGTHVYDPEDAEICLVTDSTPDLAPSDGETPGSAMVIRCRSFWRGLHQCLQVTFHPVAAAGIDRRLALPGVMWRFIRTMNDGNTAFTRTFYGFTDARRSTAVHVNSV